MVIETDRGIIDTVSGVIGRLVIDDFEDNDLSEWTLQTNSDGTNVSIGVSDGNNNPTHTYEARYSGYVRHDGNENATATMTSSSSLPDYPSPGDTHSVWVQYTPSNFDVSVEIHYGWDGSSIIDGRPDGAYFVRVRPQDNIFELYEMENANYTRLDSVSVSLSADTFYQYVIDWGGGGSHSIDLKDINGNIASLSGNDSQHTGTGIAFGGQQTITSEDTYIYCDLWVIE